MLRISCAPRFDYKQRIEEAGLRWHQDGDYWNERAYYELTPHEVNELESATNELHARALEAVGHVIENLRYSELGIPVEAWTLIERSWYEDWPSLYGRFDLAYDGTHDPPKLLEYNADTPTALVEAAVVQWHWLADLFPGRDQFNSIHEKLRARWQELAPRLPGGVVHFAGILNDLEDWTTLVYLADTAGHAGIGAILLDVGEVGWNRAAQSFVGVDGESLRNVFKLYPWEWMAQEPFFERLTGAGRRVEWIEPPWKMILSSKAILAVLWDLFPGHPNLLETHLDGRHRLEHFVKKPFWGREGQGVEILSGPAVAELGFVYQKFAPTAAFDGYHPVIGSWVIGDDAAGIGIRESAGLVTNNTSSFVPHLF